MFWQATETMPRTLNEPRSYTTWEPGFENQENYNATEGKLKSILNQSGCNRLFECDATQTAAQNNKSNYSVMNEQQIVYRNTG